MYKRALFIFRRDLRLEDNTGLLFALSQSREVVPCFIFTPEQITENPYRSDRCVQFMLESLEDLEEQLGNRGARLFFFFSDVIVAIRQLVAAVRIDAVVVNRDYTPYSISRDQKISSLCQELGLAFHSFDDLLLSPPEVTVKANAQPYRLFTPFFQAAAKLDVLSPVANRRRNYYRGSIPGSHSSSLFEKILPVRRSQNMGGRKACIRLLGKLDTVEYAKNKDSPALSATTHLSAHLKFTTCSVREIYHKIVKKGGAHSELIRALYWREFFTKVAFHYPHVFGHAFQEKFNRIAWDTNRAFFKKWCEGRTGFPLVDAGMRELIQTGFIHNRLRLVVASLLVKDLHIDWRKGERFFAQTLIDYDPAINNGNWQWVAGTGCDAQPYFRIFNPWLQQRKFDPNCLYIKRWVPELAEVPAKVIHQWALQKHWNSFPSYPSPIVNHTLEARRAIERYK